MKKIDRVAGLVGCLIGILFLLAAGLNGFMGGLPHGKAYTLDWDFLANAGVGVLFVGLGVRAMFAK